HVAVEVEVALRGAPERAVREALDEIAPVEVAHRVLAVLVGRGDRAEPRLVVAQGELVRAAVGLLDLPEHVLRRAVVLEALDLLEHGADELVHALGIRAEAYADGVRPGEAVGARAHADAVDARSEEHTSELQSRENLVCRLLLEKKKAAF